MLNKKQFRMTEQRKVILEELKKSTSHPAADEIYEMVRKRLTRVSMGTVYRNLETMSESGVILKLAGTPMRFDGDTREHHHIRCIHCSRVDDLHTDEKIVSQEKVEGSTDWEIVGHQIEFFGICPTCKAKTN